VHGRSGRTCASRLGAAVSLRGSNRILALDLALSVAILGAIVCQTSTARTALLGKIRAGSHSNEADDRPHGTFVSCDQKASVPVREHFTDSLLPNVLQYPPLRAQKRGRLFALSIPGGGNPTSRAVMSAGAVFQREPRRRVECSAAAAVADSAAARPDQHKLCL
jgi:hypothetical protein